MSGKKLGCKSARYRVLNPGSLIGIEGPFGPCPPSAAASAATAVIVAVISAAAVAAAPGESCSVRTAGSVAVPAITIAFLIRSVVHSGPAATVPSSPVAAAAAVASVAVIPGPVASSHLRPFPAPVGGSVAIPGTGRNAASASAAAAAAVLFASIA
jgi:hypothetical protein